MEVSGTKVRELQFDGHPSRLSRNIVVNNDEKIGGSRLQVLREGDVQIPVVHFQV